MTSFKTPAAIPLTMTLLCLMLLALSEISSAEQFGDFTYSVHGGGVSITDYPEDATGEVVIPAEIEGVPVTRIRSAAFLNCTGLTSIAIPEGVTWLGDRAFADCTGLTSVTIPASITEIGWESFSGCTALTSVTLQPGLTVIGDAMFRDCTGLANVTIPSSVAEIRSRAFSGCSGLTGISIPERVTRIGDDSFAGCTLLERIDVAPENPVYWSHEGVLYVHYVDWFIGGERGLRLKRCPAGKTGTYAIPDGVLSVGARSNSTWWGLSPSGENSFGGCRKITGITIPASVRGGTRPSAFTGCDNLERLDVAADNPVFASRDGVIFSKDMTELIVFPSGKAGAYVIPDGVTKIRGRICSDSGCSGDPPFGNCSGLTSVIIPSSVTEIGGQVFSGCSLLKSAIFRGSAPHITMGFGGSRVFGNPAADFAIYYLSSSSGFSSPNWIGYPALEIDGDQHPAATWLLSHGLPYDTDIHQGTTVDGVSLLLAYALDLDPNMAVRGSLPAPVLRGDNLKMTFHAASPGITYCVETSTDLQNWTGDGVVLSELDAESRRTAIIDLGGAPQRFVRLVVDLQAP